MDALPETVPGRCIRFLGDVRPEERTDFGPKAAMLGRLKQLGFDVPDGFCIGADAFAYCQDGVMLPELERRILRAYRQLGGGAVAVRSSARDEDLAGASAAGLYDSVLSVIGEQAVLDAVIRCLESLDAPDARCRRALHGRSAELGAMSVLVQRMVAADAAGVVYTADPLTGRRDRLCLHVTRGLGDAVTGGRVHGETQLTDRAGNLVRSDHLESGRAVLGAARRRAVAAVADRLEAALGGPLDIELAFEGDRLQLLQVRPIAATQMADAASAAPLERYLEEERRRLRARLAQLRGRRVVRAGEAVLSNGNIAELLPNATPISLDLFKAIFTARGAAIVRGRQRLGYAVPDDGAEALLETFCGQPYFNLEVDARTYDSGFPLDIDGYLARARLDPGLANYPELGLYEQVPSRAEACRRLGRVRGFAMHRQSEAFQDRLRRRAESVLDRWEGHDRMRLERESALALAIDWSGKEASEVVALLREGVRYLKDVACVEFVVAARLGFFFAERIRVALARLRSAETEGLQGRLLQGLEGSRITDLSLDLERWGRGELAMEAWLADYGHLAPNELELSSPRYAEIPGSMQRLGQRLAAASPTPCQRLEAQRRDREAADAELRALLPCYSLTAAAKLSHDLRLARAFLPLRETIKLHYTAHYAAFRRGLLRLAELYRLEPDLVFHLRLAELGEPPRAERLERRRETRRLGRRLLREGRLPAVIFEGRIDAVGREARRSDGDRLTGRAMAPGRGIGRVRILDLDQEDPHALMLDLQGDEVLVTRSANLGLASLLRGCAGLVVEVGGLLAHAACQARESGIPAIVLENATRLLRDGMLVRIDGALGSILILDA